MHVTEYGNYEELVSTLIKTSIGGVLLFTIQHESDDDYNEEIPEINIPAEIVTSNGWKVIEKSTFMILKKGRLEEIWKEMVKLVLRLRMGEFEDVTSIIIDGIILKISDIFSHFLEKRNIEFDEFNLRLVYGIFDKINELDEVSGYKVQINEGSEIWKIVEKIYLPCKEVSNYDALLKEIDEGEVESTMGDCSFVKLSDVLKRCNIKWIYD